MGDIDLQYYVGKTVEEICYCEGEGVAICFIGGDTLIVPFSGPPKQPVTFQR
jgi:hypothetical protein